MLGAIARRVAENKRAPLVDRCPFDHPPLCGLAIGDVPDGAQPSHPFRLVPCTHSEVRIFMEADATVTFLLSYTFTWDESVAYRATGGKTRFEDATLLFPISEFGRVKDFSCRVNGAATSLRGDIIRRLEADADDDFLVPVRPGEAQERNEAARKKRMEAEAENERKMKEASFAERRRAGHTTAKEALEDHLKRNAKDKTELPVDLYYFRARRLAAQFVVQRQQQIILDEERRASEAAKRQRTTDDENQVEATNAATGRDSSRGTKAQVEPPERRMTLAQLGILDPTLPGYSLPPGAMTTSELPPSDRPYFKNGAPIRVEVRVRCEAARDRDGRLNAILPMTSLVRTRLPREIHVYCHMPRHIRRVVATNKGMLLHTVLRGKRASAVIENAPRAPLRVEDYCLVVAVELGEPIAPQCADPMSLLILVSFVLAMIFVMTTSGLMDETF